LCASSSRTQIVIFDAFKATAFKVQKSLGRCGSGGVVMLKLVSAALVVVTASLPILFAASGAICGDQVWWPSSPSSLPSGFVGADYTHDDGGALVIFCDTSKKLISYLLIDPRAHWQKGTPVSLTIRADDGSASGPTAAVVIAPTKLVVGEQST